MFRFVKKAVIAISVVTASAVVVAPGAASAGALSEGPGYSGTIVTNGYGSNFIGAFNLDEAGGPVRAYCVEADVGHVVGADYTQSPTITANAQLDTLLWLPDAQTGSPDTAAAVAALTWYYIGATRTGSTTPIWHNTETAQNITPTSPVAWNALPLYTGSSPVGMLQLGVAHLDAAEAEVFRIHNLVQQMIGPWSMDSPVIGATTVSSRVVNATGQPIPNVSVAFDFGCRGTVTSTTAANGVATATIPTGCTDAVSVTATVANSPGTHSEWSAPGSQRLASAGAPRSFSADIGPLPAVQSDPLVVTQISNNAPVVGETLSDSVEIGGLLPGATATVQLQAFDLTLDPSGTGTPLVDATVPGLGNGITTGLAPFVVAYAQAGHSIGYRERIVSTTDGAPTGAWSTLGIANETGQAAQVAAEVHLRKTVASASQPTFVNAQSGTTPTHTPTAAPAIPADGSFDNAGPDADDGLPVYLDGDTVSFEYQVWLDDASTGTATWPGAPAGVVTDDNGTPADVSDDFQPDYVSGDDGDGILEDGEIWLYEAVDQRTAVAGETYRNMSSTPPGIVVNPETDERPSGVTTSSREDPAGYTVPCLATSATDQADGDRVLQPEGGTIVDVVSYCNLVVGQEYTATASVIATIDGVETPFTGTTTFTPTTADGTVNVEILIGTDGVEIVAAGNYVVYEHVTLAGTDTPVAEHSDPDDPLQTVTVRREIIITTQACQNRVVLAANSSFGSVCDQVTVTGDPGDVVDVEVTVYPVVNDQRVCSDPGRMWSTTVTLVDDGTGLGVAEWTTPNSTVAFGEYEFIETGSTADGRVGGRDCETSERVDSEFVVVVRQPSFTSQVARLVFDLGEPTFDTFTVTALAEFMSEGDTAEMFVAAYSHPDARNYSTRTCTDANRISEIVQFPVLSNGSVSSPDIVVSEAGFASFDAYLVVTFADGSTWTSPSEGCMEQSESFQVDELTPDPQTPDPQTPTPDIPVTGSDATALTMRAGGVTLVGGLMLMLVGRRRREDVTVVAAS